MQIVKIPVSDTGAFSEALNALPNNSQIYNRENKTLYVKKDEPIPIGSEVSYTKGIDAFYFRGESETLSEWPNFGPTSVVYVKSDFQIGNEIFSYGFYVNIGTEENPNWKPFCHYTGNTGVDEIKIGTIFQTVLRPEFIPEGYLICDGSIVSRDDYPDLFSFLQVDDGVDLYRLPNISDDFSNFMIKVKDVEFDDLIGTVYYYVGDEKNIPDGYENVCIRLPILSNFNVFSKAIESTYEVYDDEFIFGPLANEYTHILIKTKNVKKIPTGLIMMFPQNFTPEGFVVCDGSEIPKPNFRELYKKYGSKYGSSSVYFNLPNIDTEYINFSVRVGKVENNIN